MVSCGVTVDAMTTQPLLGRHLAAMITPMTPDGQVSRTDVERLVDHLVDGGCDGIVVAGTTVILAPVEARARRMLRFTP